MAAFQSMKKREAVALVLLLMVAFHQSAAKARPFAMDEIHGGRNRNPPRYSSAAEEKGAERLFFTMLPRVLPPPSGPIDGINGNKN